MKFTVTVERSFEDIEFTTIEVEAASPAAAGATALTLVSEDPSQFEWDTAGMGDSEYGVTHVKGVA